MVFHPVRGAISDGRPYRDSNSVNSAWPVIRPELGPTIRVESKGISPYGTWTASLNCVNPQKAFESALT